MSDLAQRIRMRISGFGDVREVRMFGGLCFMLDGNMLVCVMKDGALLVRVGDGRAAEALARPGTARMQMAGRTMKDFVVVAPAALDDTALAGWLDMARAFVAPMPPKREKRRKP